MLIIIIVIIFKHGYYMSTGETELDLKTLVVDILKVII